MVADWPFSMVLVRSALDAESQPCAWWPMPFTPLATHPCMQHTHGNVLVRATYDKTYELVVTPTQATILALFNDGEWSVHCLGGAHSEWDRHWMLFEQEGKLAWRAAERLLSGGVQDSVMCVRMLTQPGGAGIRPNGPVSPARH